MKARKFAGFIIVIIMFGLLLVGCDSLPTAEKQGNTLAINSPSPEVVTAASPLPTTLATVTLAPTVPATVTPAPAAGSTATAVQAASPTPEPISTGATTNEPAITRPANVAAPARTTGSAPSPKTTNPATTITPKTTLPVITARPTTIAPAPFTTVASPPYTGPLTEVVRGRTGKKEVAITLDAGAGAEPFPKMIAALNKANVKITFFLTGGWAQQNPNYVQQIVSSGQEIANHTWSHPDLTKIREAEIKSEIERTDAFLSRFTGQSSRPLWRAPFGSRDARVMGVVNSLGYRSIFWTIDSLDSVGQPKSAKFLIDRITGQSDAQLDGQIILMHIGNATSADALPLIIQNLQQRGFRIVTVSELLK